MVAAQRIVVLGLDGVPHSLVTKYINKGLMPELARITRMGSLSRMQTTIPDISCVAWSSFMTGKNPGKHGIFGFYDFHKPDYKIYFPNSTSLKQSTLWNIINKELNRSSIIINMPFTYPALPVNGYLISGFVAIDINKAVYPAEIIPDLQSMNYKIDVDFKKISQNKELIFEDIFEELEIKVKVIDYFWKKTDWQLFCCVITGTDRLQHFYMDAYENISHPFNAKFEEYYSKLDSLIGYLYSLLGENDIFLVLSDHGFEKINREVYVNKLFRNSNLLEDIGTETKCFENITDKTVAVSLDPGRIYINRNPDFTKAKKLIKEQYNDLISIIETNLKNLKDESGRKIISKIVSRDDLYKGDYSLQSPDLVLIPESGFNLKATLKTEELIALPSVHTGMHNYHDAFIATNYPVKHSKIPDITDITPSILQLSGVDIKKYNFDGNPFLPD